MIELININKSFGAFKALKDVNLYIKPHEIMGIIGKSGAGKSILLRIMNLLEQPNSGEILIDNEQVLTKNKAKTRAIRQKMAMIFQHFFLLSTQSVFNNIALPLRIQGWGDEAIHSKVMSLLQLVELTDKADAFPASLSGGQKQRVAIARALSTSPKILLCDEPTSALDPKTTEAILSLLKKINKQYGITIVIITHDMDIIKRICHRLTVIEAGSIIETMPLENILSNPESHAYQLLYKKLSPKLPAGLKKTLTEVPNDHPLLKLLFHGNAASFPFISQTSRELNLNINILLANVDRFATLTCGVLIVALHADTDLLTTFINRCEQAHLTVEILGYVDNTLA